MTSCADRKVKNGAFLLLRNSWVIMALLTGVIVAVMALWMSATGSRSLTNSLNFGKVSDARYASGVEASFGNGNKNRSDYRENCQIDVGFGGDFEEWNYLYIDIAQLDVESVDVQLSFGRMTCEDQVFQKEASLKEGLNCVQLPGEKFGCIRITIKDFETCRLTLENVQVREKDRVHIGKKDCMVAAGAFLIYFGIVTAIYLMIKKTKIRLYSVTELLQDIYIAVGNKFLWIPKKMPEKVRAALRTALIMFWMIYMMFMANMSKYSPAKYYKYHFVICVLIVLSLALLLLERELHRVKWNGQIVFCWLVLSVIMCVSEFFHEKRFLNTGYAFLIFFGFFYFVWNQASDRTGFLRDMIRALRYTFWIGLCVSVPFRPLLAGGYAGPTWNPNVYAMFLAPVEVAVLTDLLETLRRKQKARAIERVAELFLCVAFMFLTGSRLGELCAVIVIAIFVVYVAKRARGFRAALYFSVCLAFAGAFFISPYLGEGITALVENVGRPMEYPADDRKLSEQQSKSNVAYAADVANDQFYIEKIVYNIRVYSSLTGRNMYWMGYLRRMNVLGHYYYPRFWKLRRTAHNGILATSYTYGILAAVPYLFLFLNALCVSFYRMVLKKRSAYDFFVSVTFIVAFCVMMVENFERPFLATEWILFYLLLGSLFLNCEVNNRMEIASRQSVDGNPQEKYGCQIPRK